MSTDANANFNQMLNANKLGESSGGAADSPEKMQEQVVNDAIKGATKILGIGFVSQLLGQGIAKAYESAGWASGSINKGASSLTVGANSKLGALLDQVGLAAGKVDFSKIVSPEVSAPAVEAMASLSSDVHQGQHLSYGDLGNLHSNAPGRQNVGSLSVA